MAKLSRESGAKQFQVEKYEQRENGWLRKKNRKRDRESCVTKKMAKPPRLLLKGAIVSVR